MSTQIYHGAWINWSHGLIGGATLTVSDRNGGLLTSFIATFVTIVGVQLWKIISFAIHQIRSSTKAEDGLYHQQQAIWRNTTAPGGAAWTFMLQIWYWRSKANRAFLRTFAWAAFAVIYLVIFALAAVFSSEISKAPGSQRLVISNDCGFWALDNSSTDGTKAYRQRVANSSMTAATYARACYGGLGDKNTLQCSRYSKPYIEWTANANATCPFQAGSCVYTDTAAFEMTSKLMDSQLDLGINTPPKQRLQFQKRTTCAPLRQKGYINITNIPIDMGNGTFSNDTWWQVMFGPAVPGKINYTESVSTHAYNDNIGYGLTSVMAWPNDLSPGKGSWEPIPKLYRSDADMALIFLKINSMRFPAPSYDPWIAASFNIPNDLGFVWYASDVYINTLGCTEQYRFCNPTNNKCTDFVGSLQLLNGIVKNVPSSRIGLNIMQSLVASRIAYTISYSNLYQITSQRGASALRIAESAFGLDQSSGVPNNQWHKEVSAWFDTGLAAIQQHVLEYATGPISPITNGSVLQQPQKSGTNESALSEYLCYSQIIKDSSNTMSFSIVGMTVLFILGGLIIFVSLVLDRVVSWLQVWFKFNLHGRRAWLLDDKLQMQKMVFERYGMGRWKDGDEDFVPVTVEKDKFPRFTPEQLYSPNSPDGPVEHETQVFYQKTEYTGQQQQPPVLMQNPGVYMRHPSGQGY